MIRRKHLCFHSVLETLQEFGYALPRDREQVQNAQLERMLWLPDTPDMQTAGNLPPRYRVGYASILPAAEHEDLTLMGTLAVRQLRQCVPENMIVHHMKDDAFAFIIPAEVILDELRTVIARLNREQPQPLILSLCEVVQARQSFTRHLKAPK